MEIRNKEIRAVSELNPGFSCQGAVGEFIGLYLQCEVLAKKLQQYYRKDVGRNGSYDLQVQVLEASIKHFSLEYNTFSLKLLFKGGSGTRGRKSARQLRNGYLHSLSNEDKNEIKEKTREYVDLMRCFLLLQISKT